ncbi:MAG: DUF4270 family protein [Bacteroidia bacterium]|nr:DUF4270 family protein [Bacteroidia bacterium]
MNIRIKIINSLVLICAVLFIAACKKDHSVLDTGTQPGNDELNAEQLMDLPITAHTIFGDSIVSFKERYKFLGSNSDPVFGKTDVGLYTNMSLSFANKTFPSATLTTAEIVLAYDASTFVGDPTTQLTCSVYPVKNSLDTSAYYSTNDRMHETTPIFISPATKTVASNGQAILKIDFDKTYASNLMLDTTSLKSNDSFREKYKGFYITASSNGGEGIIYKVDLENDLSGFYVYYKDSPSDSISYFKFPFSGSKTTNYNTIKYSPAQNLVNAVQDSTQGGNNLYLKGFGSTKLKIQIPFLKNMSDSFYISVNRAEVVFYQDPSLGGASGVYEEPPQLSLLLMDSLGKEKFTADNLTGTAFSKYGGSYDSDNKRYVFNIASEVQAILSGKKKNRGFYLVVARTFVGIKEEYNNNAKEIFLLRRDNYAERVILAGYNNPSLKPRLNLSFVKLRNEIK